MNQHAKVTALAGIDAVHRQLCGILEHHVDCWRSEGLTADEAQAAMVTVCSLTASTCLAVMASHRNDPRVFLEQAAPDFAETLVRRTIELLDQMLRVRVAGLQ